MPGACGGPGAAPAVQPWPVKGQRGDVSESIRNHESGAKGRDAHPGGVGQGTWKAAEARAGGQGQSAGGEGTLAASLTAGAAGTQESAGTAGPLRGWRMRQVTQVLERHTPRPQEPRKTLEQDALGCVCGGISCPRARDKASVYSE